MMLNKAYAHLSTLIIFTQERASWKTFTYSKWLIKTLKKMWNMFKGSNKDTRNVFVVNFGHISHLLSSVSVEFE